MTLRIGTRPSALAMAQTGIVADRLRAAGHDVELVEIRTSGDLSSAPVIELGVGVFVSALREALVNGTVDVAVHSYKDLPTAPDPRLTLAAVPLREDPRDALVARDGKVLGELPNGSRIGTGSPRRTVGTMLQDEAFHFLRIGSFLERADNTARLLDVKFHAVETEFFGAGLGPRIGQSQGAGGQVQSLGGMTQSQGFTTADSSAEGSAAANGNGNGRDIEYDFYHWSAILRSVSGFEVYRKVYRNVIRPEKVAELLILRADMPRSLAACMHEVMSNLHFVANEQSKDTLRLAGRLRADLQYGRIDEILATGLHAFLTQFLERVNTLGVGISRDFLVPVAA